MAFSKDVVKQDVRKCLDRNETTSTFLSDYDSDTLNIDDIIESKILQAVDTVHYEAPLWMLEPELSDKTAVWKEIVTDPTDGNYNIYISGYVKMPTDFLRLVMFKMPDWTYPVYNAISMTDPEYIKQKSSVKGIRGNPDRPVCVLTNITYTESTVINGTTVNVTKQAHVIEFYSCYIRQLSTDAKPNPEGFLYMPKAKFVSSNINSNTVITIDISPLCYDAVINMIAGLTLASCKEFDAAKHMMEIARSYYNKQI